MFFRRQSGLILTAFVTFFCALPCPRISGQTISGQVSAAATQPAQQQPAQPADPIEVSNQPSSQASPGTTPSGTISGTVVDQTGAVLAGAQVRLTCGAPSASQAGTPPAMHPQPIDLAVQSGGDGEFTFTNIAPGPFQLTVTSRGFSVRSISGTLSSGEIDVVPEIVMGVATNVTEVEVGIPRVEIAEEQIKLEEKQRIFGAIPNFYVTYVPNAVPLTPKQKFELAWKSIIDPITFLVVGGIAGVQQAQNHFEGYGQGAEGYAKRFGANYADNVTGTLIGGAILPSILKQDPRYFYKGTGSTPHRAMYAIANAVICKGDNGRWQVNYSNILGSLAAGGISNIYYPSQDRDGATLTFENAAIGLGANAITNLMQEFVLRRLTPKAKRDSNLHDSN